MMTPLLRRLGPAGAGMLAALLACVPRAAADGAALQAELLSAAPAVAPFDVDDPAPLAWESPKRPEAKMWSEYSFRVVNQYLDVLDQARDIELFCPKYRALDRARKVETWADVMAGISYWETGWDPRNRTPEGDQGVDDVTKRPVYSEGLLQLSYQDQESNPYCVFDWNKDQLLPETDLHRTILNPYNNLYCGIRIMADLVKANGRIVVARGGYWSTVQAGNIHDRARQIERRVGSLPFCGGRPGSGVNDKMLGVLKKLQTDIKRLQDN